jgi:hypothetical protein
MNCQIKCTGKSLPIREIARSFETETDDFTHLSLAAIPELASCFANFQRLMKELIQLLQQEEEMYDETLI